MSHGDYPGPVTTLHIGPQITRVESGGRVLELAIGSARTAGDCLRHDPPGEADLENAIQVVEDEVMRIRTQLAEGSALVTADPALRQVALLAGVPDGPEMVLALEPMERTFDRLAAVAAGASWDRAGLPPGNEFAATLLILREFMHHLKFTAILIRR